ncbi:XdhC family protein [Sporomusa aerivorans]|uniref:XdhC family protein n=1 Tax=Sporomusa aerivorans TaxID=204936 RepID=UPI00352AAC5A
MFNKLLSAVEAGGSVNVLTVIDCVPADAVQIGQMIIVEKDGNAAGQLDSTLLEKIKETVQKSVWVKPVIITLEAQQGGSVRLFWDRLVKKRSAVVFGGGHISQPLVQMLSLLDFAVTVIDDRPEFANTARFPGASKVICENFQQAVQHISVDSDTAVIIVTRGHRYDLDCLRSTMDSNAGYLGMIGSRKRIREIIKLIKEEGAPPDIENRLRAPIGLDLKGETPAEIAVSIAAEVVAVFRGGSAASLSAARGCSHG